MPNQAVVIADDDAEMRAWLRVLLRSLRVPIMEVSNGLELLEMIAEQGPFSLVITDVRMPALSGLQVAIMARIAGFSTPFLVITAFPDDQLRQTVSVLPDTMLLDKPFETTEFIGMVKQLIERGGSVSRSS